MSANRWNVHSLLVLRRGRESGRPAQRTGPAGESSRPVIAHPRRAAGANAQSDRVIRYPPRSIGVSWTLAEDSDSASSSVSVGMS